MERFARLEQLERTVIPRARRSGIVAALVVALAFATLLAPAATAPSAAASPSCPWLNPSLPVSQRMQMLMSAMTLGDKINMVTGAGFSEPYVFYIAGIPSLCIPPIGEEDGPLGVGDGLTGVTQMPAAVSLAATFDPSLAQQYGQVVGSEERSKGSDGKSRTDREHRPRPTLGQVIRGVYRGPLPERQDGGVGDRRGAEPG